MNPQPLLTRFRKALLSAAFGLPVLLAAQPASAQETSEAPPQAASESPSPSANTPDGLRALIAEFEAQLAQLRADGGETAPLVEQIATLRTQLENLEDETAEAAAAPDNLLEADVPQTTSTDTTEQPQQEIVAEPLNDGTGATEQPAADAAAGEVAAEDAGGSVDGTNAQEAAPLEQAQDRSVDQPTTQEDTVTATGADNSAEPAQLDAAAESGLVAPAARSAPASAEARNPAVETSAGEVAASGAPAPAPVAPATQEAAVQQATETPTAVVSDQASAEQLQALEQAEAQRRENARAERAKLLGAGLAGVAVGAILNETLGGGRVVADEGDRLYIERNGEIVVQRDENALLRDDGARVETQNLDNGVIRETVFRQNGSSVITDRDRDTGEIIYRSRIWPDGQEVVLIDNRAFADLAPQERFLQLPETIERKPLSEIIVEAEAARQEELARALEQERIRGLERSFDLQTVRQNQEVRDLVRRIDLSNVQFASGSFAVREAEVRKLGFLANAMAQELRDEPTTLFLVEGHTDAVGSDLSNLDLSDRRAETVARILISAYGIPAENLITQGYGERFLKVNTQDANQANRRVTVRNITPLVASR
ncbi:MAG: OmpA family protein [Pseudomonadota bacterium]